MRAGRLKILQRRKQRQREQSGGTKDEAERERPEAAAVLCRRDRLRPFDWGERLLALDHAAGDIIGDRRDDCGHIVRFGKHLAAMARVSFR